MDEAVPPPVEATKARPAAAEPVRRLLRPVDLRRDHGRGGAKRRDRATVVVYGDYLCPYCRRLRPVLERLHKALGERMS